MGLRGFWLNEMKGKFIKLEVLYKLIYVALFMI